MNKLFIVGICIVGIQLSMNSTSRAQDLGKDKTEVQTIFSKSSTVTGFGGLDTKYTNIAGQDALIIGGQGGVIFDSHFYIGLGGYNVVSRHRIDAQVAAEDLDLEMGYAGLILAFNVAPKKVVHMSFPVLFGAGDVRLDEKTFGGFNVDGRYYTKAFVENSPFLVIEPGVQIEINLADFMKIGLGASYRKVQGVSLKNDLHSDDLSSWCGNISFIFGVFN